MQDTKQFLQRYYFMYLKVESLKRELEALETLACGTQGCSFDTPRVQKTPSLKAPFVMYIDKIDKANKRLETKLNELLKLKDEIQESIATVNDPIPELVLTMRYINLMDWEDIAKKLHYTLSYTFKLHRKGLENVKIKEDSKRQ